MSTLCPEDQLQAVIDGVRADEMADLEDLFELIELHPEDARLHFLKGSALISRGDLIGAHRSLSRAVELAPDFAIARFQLGFFQLTSGEANEALKTWAPLDALPGDHYLKAFAQGLRHLIRDAFSECVSCLQKGIELNNENLPLNKDMALIIEQCGPLLDQEVETGSTPQQSETSALLSRHAQKPTTH